MGLLDQFAGLGNLNPEQTQGLLGAAAQILQGAGSGRQFGLGQALGAGISGYQQAVDNEQQKRLQRQQAAQTAKLLGLKIQDAESDLLNQKATRDRAEQLRQFYIARGAGGGAVNTPAAMGNNLAPTVANAELLQSLAPQAQGGDQKAGIYQQRLAEAQALRNAGFGPEADAAEAAALKFQPKVKGWEKVQQGGKVLFAPFFEDGTSGAPVPLEVAEKLQFQNTGGHTLGLNPFTGQQVASFANSQSPDSAASVAATLRGQTLSNSLGRDRLALDKLIADNKAAQDKAPTEFQGKSAAYGLRAREADKILTDLTGKYSPAKVNSKLTVAEWPLIGGALGAATNSALSESDQQAEQAQRDFINAVLRQESGAAIGASEFDNARKQYFPQPGDSEGTIAQKARNRQLAIQGFETNAGKAKMSAPAKNNGWGIEKVN